MSSRLCRPLLAVLAALWLSNRALAFGGPGLGRPIVGGGGNGRDGSSRPWRRHLVTAAAVSSSAASQPRDFGDDEDGYGTRPIGRRAAVAPTASEAARRVRGGGGRGGGLGSGWDRRRPVALLTRINIAVFLLQCVAPRLTDAGAKVNAAIVHDRQYYRLLSAVFLHGSPLHLAANTWSLGQLGPNVLRTHGSKRRVIASSLARAPAAARRGACAEQNETPTAFLTPVDAPHL